MKKATFLKSLLLAAGLCVGASAWGETITYDFKSAVASGGIAESNLTSSGTVAGYIAGTSTGVYFPSELSSSLNNLLAFQYRSGTNVWAIDKNTRGGLWCNCASGSDENFSLCNLQAGDVVTITINTGEIFFSGGITNATYDNDGTETTPAQWAALVSGTPYTIKGDGKLDLQAKKFVSGTRGHCSISKIVIERSKTRVWGLDFITIANKLEAGSGKSVTKSESASFDTYYNLTDDGFNTNFGVSNENWQVRANSNSVGLWPYSLSTRTMAIQNLAMNSFVTFWASDAVTAGTNANLISALSGANYYTFQIPAAGTATFTATNSSYIYSVGVYTSNNEIIGLMDKSTRYEASIGSTQHKDLSLTGAGKRMKLNFDNHGSTGANYKNWALRIVNSGTSFDRTLAGGNHINGGDTGCTLKWLMDGTETTWVDYDTQMQDANVDMTITYTPSGMFSVVAEATCSAHTYTYKFSYGTAFSGAVTMELGVDLAWLELKSNETVDLYTATFTANEGAISPTVTIYSNADRTIEAANGELEDGATYYYRAVLDGYETYDGTFTVNAAAPSESFTMASVYNYTVQAVDASNTNTVLATLAEGYVYPSTNTYTHNIPFYVLSGTTLYKQNSNSVSGEITSNNQVVKVEYTAQSITDCVFYVEGEDIDGKSGTVDSSAGNSSSFSNKAMGRFSSETTFTTVAPGKYIIVAYIHCGNPSHNADATLKAGSKTVGTKNITSGNQQTFETAAFNVYESTNLKILFGGSNATGVDYIYVRKTADIAAAVAAAVADCKTYETSDAFTTHIDGLIDAGSLTTAAQVYADHTAWQIAQADAASSLDYTKAIRNAAVADATDWTNAGTYSGEQYTGAPDASFIDNYGAVMDAYQTIYGLPAGKYQLKVATRADADNFSKVYVKSGDWEICSARGEHVGNSGGDLGNGWSWTYVPFEITSTTDVVIGFYKDAVSWAGADDWHLYKVTANQSVDISSAGWATLFTPYALDFSGVSGLTAYTAALDNTTVELTAVSNVPARTGVVLKGAEKTYSIPLAASSSTSQGDLKGSPTWATDYNDSYDYYYLTLDAQNKAQFTILKSGGSIAAGKAYLVTSKSEGARVLKVVFANDISDITTVQGEGSKVNGEYYNLSGQRVNAPQKGLYIVNGKKVIIK